jgi:hypothetical protein
MWGTGVVRWPTGGDNISEDLLKQQSRYLPAPAERPAAGPSPWRRHCFALYARYDASDFQRG